MPLAEGEVEVTQLPPKARLYWLIVVSTGAGVLTGSVAHFGVSAPSFTGGTWLSLTLLAALAVYAERTTVPFAAFGEQVPNQNLSAVTAIAAIMTLPWFAAVLLTTLALIIVEWRKPPIKTAFNAAYMAVVVALSAFVYDRAGGGSAVFGGEVWTKLWHGLPVMVLTGAVFYISAAVAVAILFSLLCEHGAWQTYSEDQLQTIFPEVTIIALGLMLGGFWHYNPAFVVIVAIPAIMAYFSFENLLRIQGETRRSVLAMAESIDHRDPLTYNHSKRVAELSVTLGRALNLSNEQIATLELGGLVHDIGKIGLSSDILMKAGPLTVDERTQMQQHPVIGYDMLVHYRQFRRGLGIVRWHHEMWDGRGYPDGLKACDTPLEARVVGIADAFEAMTADRPYRKAMSESEALDRLAQAAGTQFDPELVRVFCQIHSHTSLISVPDSAA